MILDGQGKPMVAVYTCHGEAEAMIVASYLREHGLPAEPDSDGGLDIVGGQFSGLWQHHVRVPEGCVDEAERLIDEAESSGAFSD